ncbi:MAG: hypothetical protein KME08_19995 [Aphanothece sp. CMT-3BRIN-NPC111]|nr:hypothetical protein [Aphanothece sp. CMT-3BRIN-NPC111]
MPHTFFFIITLELPKLYAYAFGTPNGERTQLVKTFRRNAKTVGFTLGGGKASSLHG